MVQVYTNLDKLPASRQMKRELQDLAATYCRQLHALHYTIVTTVLPPKDAAGRALYTVEVRLVDGVEDSILSAGQSWDADEATRQALVGLITLLRRRLLLSQFSDHEDAVFAE